MKQFVVDASILVKLFFPEEHSELAVQNVANATKLLAPDLIWVEAANVVWKRLRRGEIAEDPAKALVQEMLQFPIETSSDFDLIPSAMALAAATGRTVYDCLYLALALRENVPLLTGDERFANALSPTPFAARVRFIGSGA